MVTTARPTDDRRTSLLIVVVAGSVFTSIMLGVRSTFGLFLEPVVETLQTDRGTFAFAIAVQNLLWGATQPLAGANRRPVRIGSGPGGWRCRLHGIALPRGNR